MGSITIRDLDDRLEQHLRMRAAQRGRSEEVGAILRLALAQEVAVPQDLGAAIHRRFAPLGGVELPSVTRR